MSTAQKMSLYYAVSALDDVQFSVVWKMIQGLTEDAMIIEELSDEEAALYEEGFEEMRQGNYITLEDFIEKYKDCD
jgi:hypothetical protein